MKQSSFFRLDEQVIYSMGAMCLIAILVLAFRFGTKKSCTPLNLNYGKDSIFVNEPVVFKALANQGEYRWNPGTGIIENETGPSLTHTYTQARTYTVTVETDEGCFDMRTVVVHERKKVNLFKTEGPEIFIPQTITVGEITNFFDRSESSASWEWYFGDDKLVDGTTRTVNYTFKQPGNITLRVKVNDKYSKEYVLLVSDKAYAATENSLAAPSGGGGGGGGAAPRRRQREIYDGPETAPLGEQDNQPVAASGNQPENRREEPKAQEGELINNAQLASMLKDVSNGSKTAKDFEKYSCGEDFNVLYNDRNMKFSQFCSELVRMKRIKKIIPSIISTNKNNCLKIIQVDIKKSLF